MISPRSLSQEAVKPVGLTPECHASGDYFTALSVVTSTRPFLKTLGRPQRVPGQGSQSSLGGLVEIHCVTFETLCVPKCQRLWEEPH